MDRDPAFEPPRDEKVSPSIRARPDSAAEWRSPLIGAVLGLLAFETLTGLSIYLLPFSQFNQFGVLLHTAVGLVMIMPLAWYLVIHWRQRYRGNFSHYHLLGYVAALGLVVVVASGVVLTWQGLLGRRIGQFFDQAHVFSTFVIVPALSAHLLTLVLRRVQGGTSWASHRKDHRCHPLRRAQASCGLQALVWCCGMLAVCGLLAKGYTATPMNDAFPPDYRFSYGADRPFAPSLARKDMSDVDEELKSKLVATVGPLQYAEVMADVTAHPPKHKGMVKAIEESLASAKLNDEQRAEVATAVETARRAYQLRGGIDPRRLAGSAGCGRACCHAEIAREWAPSAHRYASMDFVFRRVQDNFAVEREPEAVRYCAGCHDPIALFAGAKNVGNVTLSVEGADEGVSCLVCHSMVSTDVRGNADYTVDPAERYLFEYDGFAGAQLLSDFLIRVYPRQHAQSYNRPLYKTAEACGACHKQFVDEEINNFGWVQGQNQYDSWRKSHWHDEKNPSKTISCRECHMPLVASKDPGTGDAVDPNRRPDDGKHRSHRFLAANQFVPRFHNLEGAEEHCLLTEKWLRGQVPVPEIDDRWTQGPVVSLELVTPQRVRPGQPVNIQTIVRNNKAGHEFPTGPMDMIESWIEVTVADENQNIVFASSRADSRGYLTHPEIVFKAELVDKLGALIGRHELWRLVGARFKRTLFPGASDTTNFQFTCPSMTPMHGASKAFEPTRNFEFALPKASTSKELRVSAVVWYCKFSAPFLDRLFGEAAGLRSEMTEIARAEVRIQVDHDDKAMGE